MDEQKGGVGVGQSANDLWVLQKGPPARWFTPEDLPTEPGLYYYEAGDRWGKPLPGLWYWEKDKPMNPPHSGPWKAFGPIRGALQPWPELVEDDKKPMGQPYYVEKRKKS